MIRAVSILFAFATMASAAVPSPVMSSSQYEVLWKNSPFTTQRNEVEKRVSELDHYALGGVSKLDAGYFVILLDKRNPASRVVLRPGKVGRFEVLGVDWSAHDWKKTTVLLSDGDSRAPVRFDSSILFPNPQREGGKSPIEVQRPLVPNAGRPRAVK